MTKENIRTIKIKIKINIFLLLLLILLLQNAFRFIFCQQRV